MRNPQSSKEGYLLVDHRAVPLTPEQARVLGYSEDACKILEAATLTCSHCGTVVLKNPDRTRERGRCHACDSYICDNCALVARHPDYVHIPAAKVHDDRQQYPQQFLPLMQKGPTQDG